jgi:hypothetical protein
LRNEEIGESSVIYSEDVVSRMFVASKKPERFAKGKLHTEIPSAVKGKERAGTGHAKPYWGGNRGFTEGTYRKTGEALVNHSVGISRFAPQHPI